MKWRACVPLLLRLERKVGRSVRCLSRGVKLSQTNETLGSGVRADCVCPMNESPAQRLSYAGK